MSKHVPVIFINVMDLTIVESIIQVFYVMSTLTNARAILVRMEGPASKQQEGDFSVHVLQGLTEICAKKV